PPRPLVTGPNKAPAAMDSDIVSRWVGEPPNIVGSSPVFGGPMMGGHGVMGGDCGPTCGPVCCDPCATVCCDPCAPSCCDACCLAGPCCRDRGCFWFTGEYLLWAFKHDNVPPLVTGNSMGLPASLSNPGTTVLYGGQGTDNKDFSGGRF